MLREIHDLPFELKNYPWRVEQKSIYITDVRSLSIKQIWHGKEHVLGAWYKYRRLGFDFPDLVVDLGPEMMYSDFSWNTDGVFHLAVAGNYDPEMDYVIPKEKRYLFKVIREIQSVFDVPYDFDGSSHIGE